MGEGSAVWPALLVAWRNFTEFELRHGFQGGANPGGFLRFHAGHLDENSVLALACDERLGGSHGVKATFDHPDCLIHLFHRDRHFFALFVFLRLDAEEECGSSDDIDATFEAFFGWKNRKSTKATDTNEQNGADVTFPRLDLGGEIPEEKDQQRQTDGEENERILEKYEGEHGEVGW